MRVGKERKERKKVEIMHPFSLSSFHAQSSARVIDVAQRFLCSLASVSQSIGHTASTKPSRHVQQWQQQQFQNVMQKFQFIISERSVYVATVPGWQGRRQGKDGGEAGVTVTRRRTPTKGVHSRSLDQILVSGDDDAIDFLR